MANKILSCFNSGELSPRVWRRLDFRKRQHGVAFLENFYPLVQGGLIRRAGTRFVAETKYSDKETVLWPFEFSVEAAYIIEAGEQYLRFFTNSGQVVVPDHETEITNGAFATDLTGWTTSPNNVDWIDTDNVTPKEEESGSGPPPPPPPPPTG